MSGGSMYKIKKLKNNIKIIYKKVNYLESVNLGVFIKCGSLNESKENNGISHLLEHMIFKGTGKRTAKDIALDTDRMGGDINAYTTVDYTCLYMRALSETIYDGMDILFDMLEDTVVIEDDLKMEVQVIYDEIDNCEDDPEELAMTYLTDLFFEDDSYRYNILGTKNNLDRIGLEDLLDYKAKNYVGSNMVISLVGNFNEDKVLDYIDKRLDISSGSNRGRLSIPSLRSEKGRVEFIKRDFEQVTGYINLSNKVDLEENRYNLMILNNIFGGSISSKLFQKIREEQGLTYNINSFTYDNDLEGNLNIYFTCNNDNILEVHRAVVREIENFYKYSLSFEDISISKKQLVSEFLLNIEDPYEEMVIIGEKLLLKNELYDKKEVVRRINESKLQDIEKLKDEIFSKDSYNIIYIGDVDSDNILKIKEKN